MIKRLKTEREKTLFVRGYTIFLIFFKENLKGNLAEHKTVNKLLESFVPNQEWPAPQIFPLLMIHLIRSFSAAIVVINSDNSNAISMQIQTAPVLRHA